MPQPSQDDPLATREMSPSQQAALAGKRASDRGSGSGSGRLEVRCPNCHIPTDVAADTTLTDLTCGSCGSHFSLIDQTKATRMAPALSKLGRFELIERLGVGGFGSVWKARDKELDRTVAIKVPRATSMTETEQEQFFREARAAAQLRHPNIVSVHEVGRDGDSIYIVSDFVRGVTLGDWLTGQRLTSRESAVLCARIADALHHAHEQGVVHRDLKPANIMMDFDGQPHLMDFGLARRESGEITMTVEGQILGTPAYMSPEQALGDAHAADRRSDIYSLGVIMFQLLTGELPFRGNTRMLLHQVIESDPPSPRQFSPYISKDLETITLKCLEKQPARRYQTTWEFAAEIQRVLSGQPISARPIGAVERAWRWYSRTDNAMSMIAGIYGVLLGFIFALWTVLGITLSFVGVVDTSRRMIFESTILLLTVFPLMLLCGVAAAKQKPIGLIAGTLLAVGGAIATGFAMIKSRLPFIQLEVLAAAQRDRSLHYQLCTLLLLLFTLGAFLHVAAAVAKARAALPKR